MNSHKAILVAWQGLNKKKILNEQKSRIIWYNWHSVKQDVFFLFFENIVHNCNAIFTKYTF